MPLPPAIGTCTITGQLQIPPTGAANNGWVSFTLPTELIDTTDHVVLAPGVFSATLAADGTFSITVPFNDNPGVQPTGWSYLVTENVIGGRSFYLQVSRSLGSTAKYDALIQAPVPSGPVFPEPWIPLAAVQAKGDLLPGSGTAVVTRLPVGADGQVLVVSSAAPGGLAWVTGGGIGAVSVKTSAYTLTATDVVILADASAAAFSVTLPSASGIASMQYEIKKVDTSINPVTLVTTSGQTIDGATQVIIFNGGDSIRVISDGANWRQI